MYALRSGLKRIDNKRTRGEKGKRKSIDRSNDLSACPIIDFQDANDTSPGNDVSVPWEPFHSNNAARHLSDEASISTIRTSARLQSPGHEEFTQPLTGGSFSSTEVYSSSQRKQKTNWKPLVAYEYDENIPPMMIGEDNWRSYKENNRTVQPLALEAIEGYASDQANLAERMRSPVRNPSRWQPMEHDESTEPVAGRNPKPTAYIAQNNNVRQLARETPHASISGRPSRTRHKPSVIFDPFYVGDDRVPPESSRRGVFEEGYLANKKSKDSAPYSSIQTYEHHTPFGHTQVGFGMENEGFYHDRNPFSVPDNVKEEARQEVINCDDIDFPDDEQDQVYPKRKTSVGSGHTLVDSMGRETIPLVEDNFHERASCFPDAPLEGEKQYFDLTHANLDHEPDRSFGEESTVRTVKQISDREDVRELPVPSDDTCAQAYWERLERESQVSNEEASTIRTVVQEEADHSHENVVYEVNNPSHNEAMNTEAYWRSLQEAAEKFDDSSTIQTVPQDTMSQHYEISSVVESQKKTETLDTIETQVPAYATGGGNRGLRLVVLISKFSGTLRQRTEQERAMSILKGRRIQNIEEVDGSATSNVERRHRLFHISGKSGQYPQFFLQKNEDIIVYLGDFEWLTYMNDIGSLNNATIFGVSDGDDAALDYHRSSYTPECDLVRPCEDSRIDQEHYRLGSNCDNGESYQEIQEQSEDTEEVQYLKENIQSEETHSLNHLHTMDDEGGSSLCSTEFPQTDSDGDENQENKDEIVLEECRSQSVGEESKKSVRRKGRRTLLATTGSLLDTDEDDDLVLQSPRSYSASVKSTVSADGNAVTQFQSENEHEQQVMTQESRNHSNEQNGLSVEVGFHRKNAIDTCSSFDKPEPPRVGRDRVNDEEKSSEIDEAQERRRKRWKRRILAEHRRRKAMKEKPLGATLDEIEMINIFMSIAGPSLGGPLSPEDIEDIHEHTRRAGLPVEFTTKMLDQRKSKNTRSDAQTSVAAAAQPTMSPSEPEDTYDEAGFTRKTPKEQSAFACFQSAFLAESAHAVGSDMMENVQAALDAETERKKGWSSSNMIESVKATLSGDSESKSSWPPVNMIENIKASFSGDSTEKKSGWDVIGSVKASFSVDSHDSNSTGWKSSNVFASIKNALSGDSESKRSSRTIDSRTGKGEPQNGRTLVETVREEETTMNEEGLHEC